MHDRGGLKMADFIKELRMEKDDIAYGITVDIPKLAEWAEQKDRQIQELREMVERLAFKDVKNDKHELHLGWNE
jgi:uncharacterized protein YtpQ (UPF0354 family)